MSILIKGMEMPESCAECGLEVLGRCGGNFGALLPANFRGMITRPEYCPLVTVPTPHGRLIDADALMLAILDAQVDQPELAEVYDEDYHVVLDWLRAAPTVIEAEK